jgi:hypothetical protein
VQESFAGEPQAGCPCGHTAGNCIVRERPAESSPASRPRPHKTRACRAWPGLDGSETRPHMGGATEIPT